MKNKGCRNGCIHNKQIKLPEFAEKYAFRCEAIGCYVAEESIKQSCRFYAPLYNVQIRSIEDFLEEAEWK